MKQDELNKANRISDDTLDIRIADVERALRAQVAQNKMIKNQYEKMMTQLEAVAKKNIQAVLYEWFSNIIFPYIIAFEKSSDKVFLLDHFIISYSDLRIYYLPS